jgi:hypothetical protein
MGLGTSYFLAAALSREDDELQRVSNFYRTQVDGESVGNF